MKYEYSLLIRILFGIIPLNLFYIIFTPLTVYGVYILLYFYNPVISGIDLIIKGSTFTFIEACIAGSAYYLLWLLVLSTKSIKIINRIKIIGFGFLMIFIMNLVRIFILILIDLNYGEEWFNLIHLFFWKIFVSFYVVGVWFFLTKVYKVKSIPIYSDIIYLIKEIKHEVKHKHNH